VNPRLEEAHGHVPRFPSFRPLALPFLLLISAVGRPARLGAQEPSAGRSEQRIPGTVKDVATHTTGAQDWKIPPAQVTQIAAFQFFVFTVGSRGLPEDLGPDQLRVREESLNAFDFEALAALLGK
jgi:hypothetical protein